MDDVALGEAVNFRDDAWEQFQSLGAAGGLAKTFDERTRGFGLITVAQTAHSGLANALQRTFMIGHGLSEINKTKQSSERNRERFERKERVPFGPTLHSACLNEGRKDNTTSRTYQHLFNLFPSKLGNRSKR